MKGNRTIRKICKNCKLYNPRDGVCGVTVMYEGEYLELKVRPNDRCWWERMEQELALLDGQDTEVAIQQILVQYDLDSKKVRVESPMEPPNPLA